MPSALAICHAAQLLTPRYSTFPWLHQVIQRAQRLVDRRPLVEAVDEVEVNAIGRQPAEAARHGLHDVAPRQAALVHVGAHRKVELSS